MPPALTWDLTFMTVSRAFDVIPFPYLAFAPDPDKDSAFVRCPEVSRSPTPTGSGRLRTSASWWFGLRPPALTLVFTFKPLGLATVRSVSLWLCQPPALTLVFTFKPLGLATVRSVSLWL